MRKSHNLSANVSFKTNILLDRPLYAFKNMYKYFSAIYRQKYNLHFQPFIGVDDKSQEGLFTNSDDGTDVPQIWRSGEPNNHGDDGEDCVYVETKVNKNMRDGRWNDAKCSLKTEFICEM